MNLILRHLLFSLFAALGAASLSAQQLPDANTPPPTPSPIEDFRQLLRVQGEDREKLLQAWPVEKQRVLRRKCDFYDKLPDAERRLKMLELRWYLQPLMSQEPPERVLALGSIPPDFQEIVNDRLKQWDQLPAGTKKQLLDNEMVLQYFTRLQQSSASSQASIDPALRKKMEEKLTAWRKLTPRERHTSYRRFYEFFELPRDEQQKTLHALSESERKEMEKTLQAFAKLPPEQRRVSIESFGKFASMSPAQRNEFLRNAQRWQAMTPREREQWRSLVNNLPPLPGEPYLPPPLPGASLPRSNSNTVGN